MSKNYKLQIVPCKHWEDGNVKMGGVCKKGLYGGRPSHGICLIACPHYQGKSRGLGDTVRKFTTYTGIHFLVMLWAKLRKKDCGCNQRLINMNMAFPYEWRRRYEDRL